MTISRKNNQTGKKNNQEEVRQLIYCGPTLKNGILQQYAVFQGTLPNHIEKIIESDNSVKELFVDIKDFTMVRKNISIKGSREQQLFEQALNNKL